MSFTVYRSSAGSGKTFTLVKEYLKIALTDTQDPPKAFRRILAITFTNKAAAEMKDRIIRALKELSAADHSLLSSGASTLLATLIRETGFSPDVLRERAASVLQAILHNYSDFAIGTIDSFVHKVVRSFSFDLKLPVHFEIELDASRLLAQTVDILLSQIGEEEDLTNILLEFSEHKAEEEKSWHIESDLNQLAGELLKEEGASHLALLKGLAIPDFQRISKQLKKSIRAFEEELQTKGKEGLQLIQSRHLEHAVFYQKGKGIRKYFEDLASGRKDDLMKKGYAAKTVEEDKWMSKEASSSDIAAIDSIKARLTELYYNIQEILEKSFSRYQLYKLLQSRIYSLAVLNEMEKVLDTYKKENAVLHISEFNKLIAEIVFQEPVPFIYERLGERYVNYLIDEFQDTSILQWQNLLPLVDNALSEDQFTMVVGDGKQAIYRWRGGDVEQFANLPGIAGFDDNQVVRERADSLQRHYKPEFLGSNFRSKMEIIEFNNALYRFLSASLPDNYRRIYDKLEQLGNRDNTGGLVSIEFASGEKSDRLAERENRIKSLIRTLRTEGFAYGDIAILCRANKEGNELANALINDHIPVLSNDSLLLRHSPEVNFLAACMNSLHNPQDEISRAEMIRYLSSGSDAAHLQRDLGLASSTAAFRKWMEEKNFAYRPGLLLKLPLYPLAEELLRIFRLNSRPDPYLIFFLDEILSFSNSRDNSLGSWLRHWEDRREKASATVPDGMDAVNILTIHRSKGLEYPVVILPLGDSAPKAGKDMFWVDLEETDLEGLPAGIVPNQKSLLDTRFAGLHEEEIHRTRLDNLNLLYVATTRPEERLYILAGKQPEKAGTSGNFTELISGFVEQTGMIADADGRFVIGEGKPVIPATLLSRAPSDNLKEFITTDWTEKIRIRSASREIWSEQQLQKQDTGLVLHAVLARIHTYEDLDAALFEVNMEGLLDTEESAAVRNLLLDLMNHPQLKPFFEPGITVKNEAEILLSDGTAFRPDRIVYLPGRTVILDYKTGKEASAHHEQVENYAMLLKQMGETSVEKYLVYTDELRVVTV